MGFLYSIIIGGVAGFLASRFMGSHNSALVNIILGNVGGLVGGGHGLEVAARAAGSVGAAIVVEPGVPLVVGELGEESLGYRRRRVRW